MDWQAERQTDNLGPGSDVQVGLGPFCLLTDSYWPCDHKDFVLKTRDDQKIMRVLSR